MKKISRNDGVALIITLMIIALLVAVVVEFNRIAIADIEVSKNFGDEKKILSISSSGMNAIKEFLWHEGLYTNSDTLLEDWAKSETYIHTAGAILEQGSLAGEITDENGKINVNRLVNDKGDFDDRQKAFWTRLLSQPRFALVEDEINTIIHSVKDWIDPDDKIMDLYGAEDSSYAEKGYHCGDKPLDTLEEMLLINGITEDIFFGNKYKEGIRAYFTVYGGSEININTAPLPVLMALSEDMTEDLANEMDAFRRDEANKSLLSQKNWYKKIWTAENPLPEKLLTVSSDYFTVYLRGTLGETVKQIKCVIGRDKKMTKIVYWQEM